MFKVYLLHDFITRIFLALKDFFFFIEPSTDEALYLELFFFPISYIKPSQGITQIPRCKPKGTY